MPRARSNSYSPAESDSDFQASDGPDDFVSVKAASTADSLALASDADDDATSVNTISTVADMQRRSTAASKQIAILPKKRESMKNVRSTTFTDRPLSRTLPIATSSRIGKRRAREVTTYGKLSGGNSTIIRKLQSAGYTTMRSWEDLVREIECVAFVNGSLKWYWITMDGIKMQSNTADLIRMCPHEFSWFLETCMRESINNDIVHGEPVKLQVIPLSSTFTQPQYQVKEGRVRRDLKGKQKADEKADEADV